MVCNNIGGGSMTKKLKEKKVVEIHKKEYEVLSVNRFSTRIFEAIIARGPVIMDALDKAKLKSFEKGKEESKKPIYKHTILLGKDDNGHNLRATISVFENSVVVQTLREK
ncbi:MAG: hypothetical protein QW802_04605 [Candidatus Altiarchaeota archaeon]